MMAAFAALYNTLGKPDLRRSESIVRCMAIDAVTLATGRPHHEEVAALLTLAYREAGTPCVVEVRSLQMLIQDHRLAPDNKLTEFSVYPYRQHSPKIELPY